MTDPLNKLGNFSAIASIQNSSRTVKSGSGHQELEKACHDFESLFVKYMLQTMRDTIPENSLFGGGQAEKIYTGMLDDEVARSVSEKRGIGLAAIMYAQMAALGDKDNNGK
jgi:peptidoglycan hydrolase FlgJ